MAMLTEKALLEWGLNPEFITRQFLESENIGPIVPWRFIQKVKKTETCWLWIGSVNKKCRYGYISRGNSNKTMLAHRLSFILHFGTIDNGAEICHICDVRNCVRPDHLFQGTHADNMADAARKKKFVNGHRFPTGESHPSNKLTKNQVLEIVKLNSDGISQTEIAKEFGINQSSVSYILSGKYWSHLTGISRW